MTRLTLLDAITGQSHSITDGDAILGRDPSCAIVVSGANAGVVSGRHARVFLADGKWWVEDAGSRNGTFVANERLASGVRHALVANVVIGLGESGPRFSVSEASTRVIAATMFEAAPASAAPTQPSPADHSHDPGPDLGKTMPMRPGDRATLRAGTPVVPSSLAPSSQAPLSQAPLSQAPLSQAPLSQAPLSPAPLSPAPLSQAPLPFAPTAKPGDFAFDEDARISATLRATPAGIRHQISGPILTIGRAAECSVPVEPELGAAVSRVHAEIRATTDGRIVIRDGGSRNGTLLNGRKVEVPAVVKRGDMIALGLGGPTFMVEEIQIGDLKPAHGRDTPTAAVPLAHHVPPAPAPPAPSSPPPASAGKAGPLTQFARADPGAPGRTMLFRNAIEEVSRKSAKRTRNAAIYTVIGASIVLTVVILALKHRADVRDAAVLATTRSLEQRATADSARTVAATADAERLRASFDSAIKTSASPAVIDSLRAKLADANRRTGAVEQALGAATSSLNKQLALGDSIRAANQRELDRLRAAISAADASGKGARATVDSLNGALAGAEAAMKDIDAKMRAVKGADLTQVAQMNQGAVGLVTVFVGKAIFDGSGFAITPSGYFITNRHVVTDSGAVADSVFVTMADKRSALHADIVAMGTEGGTDIAVLKIRGYTGPYVSKIDWTSSHAVQGEAAALIGFPAGSALALDSTQAARTSMSGGLFSKISADQIQFAGFTIGGSSGSPVFNAAGEVVAVHRAGLKQAAGMGFAIPVARVLPLLPAAAKSELGVK